jgi:hypothetical protein
MSGTTVAPAFQRRHYAAIAAVIEHRFAAEHPASGERWVVDAVADDLCDLFASDNPSFDRDRFLRACGVTQ